MNEHLRKHRQHLRLPIAVITALAVAAAGAHTPLRASASAAHAGTFGRRTRAPQPVNQVINHAGAYQVFTGQDLQGLLGAGMTLALEKPQYIAQFESADPGSPARYIDNLLPIIYENISGLEPFPSPSSCANDTATHGCVVTPSDVASVHAALLPELARDKADPHVVGLYIQDDPMGDTLQLDQDIHAWVAQAGLHIPTICAFGGLLNEDRPTSPATMRLLADQFEGNATTGEHGAISNFSPQGCDMVAFYPYDSNASSEAAAAAIAAVTDWKMARALWPCGSTNCSLLNFYKYALSMRGWTPAIPIIGIPQAFGLDSVNQNGQRDVTRMPTATQLADETTAFCVGGAQSILAFAWDLPDAGSSTLSNTPSLRAGLTAGVTSCKAIWSGTEAAAVARDGLARFYSSGPRVARRAPASLQFLTALKATRMGLGASPTPAV